MSTATLTDRYIDAAMRTVPEKQRADLAAELRASIDDQVDARASADGDRDAAERAVLTELGDPEVLAAGYTDRPLQLIGPRYYLEWWRLLKLLLWIVTPFAAFGVALGKTLSGAELGDVIGTTVVATLGTILHLAFWTTLVFAIIERSTAGKPSGVPSPRGAAADIASAPGVFSGWTVDNLPEPRESGAGFSDMVVTIVFLIIGAGAILWDQFIGFAPAYPGLSFLDPGLWPWWITGLFVVMAIEAILQVVVFLRGRWTFGLAAVNAALNVVVAVPALVLLFEGRLLNAEFWTTVIPPDSSETVATIMAIMTGFGIAAIALWDSIDAFLKARRAR